MPKNKKQTHTHRSLINLLAFPCTTKMAAWLMLSFCSLFISLSLNPMLVHSLTSREDVAALHSMLHSIDPISILNYSYLSTWNFSTDPCESSGGQFLGILCTFPLDNSSSRVVEIELDGIGYEGFLSPEIGVLTELTTINLRDNNFRGPIPNTISNLRKLTRLLLSGNFFTGMIPRGIRAIKKLEVIDISNNQLSGSIPPEISGLRSLKHLFLSNNGIYGTIPNLQGLWQLTTLDLSGNQLHGSLPRLPTRLVNLHLSHNILSGHVSSSIRPLVHLRTLDLNDNRFSGVIDDDILTLPEIAHVNISGNRFSELRVGKISGYTQLLVLDAHSNNLHGQLPVNLVTMEKLTTINLARNQLSGPIPVEYGPKVGKQWRSLFLDHNFLAGNIPPALGNGTIARFRGSLAINCLTCPTTSILCRGGQRPTSQCIGRNASNQ